MKLCDKCNKGFTPKVTYQIYCSAECRASATKDKIVYPSLDPSIFELKYPDTDITGKAK